MGEFLRQLAATGVVEHSARAVGLSPAAAYAFRNRRQGRAFARMWDAVLVNRSRARLASELQSRAIAGCVSVRRRDGEIVSEYHYYDNRLAMSLLTRLDRLAEREAASEAHLRTLSEDLDAFVECVEQGGDADAFVEARQPAPCEAPQPAPPAAGDAAPPSETSASEDGEIEDDDAELTRFARHAGCRDYLDVPPAEIDVLDLDLDGRDDWSADQLVRAWRSGFMVWVELGEKDPDESRGPGAAVEFHFLREAARANLDAPAEQDGQPGGDDGADRDAGCALDLADMLEWSDAQLARAWRSGLLIGLPSDFWEDLAERARLGGGDEAAEEIAADEDDREEEEAEDEEDE
jgi:hypothetical protein